MPLAKSKHDSSTGSTWVYRELAPAPLLAPYVQCYWSLESKGYPATRMTETMAPDGRTEWVFQVGSPFSQQLDEQEAVLPVSFFAGHKTKYCLLRASGPVSVFGVRFLPGRAACLLQVPMEQTTNQSLATSDVLGKQGELLQEQLADRSLVGKAALMNRHLLGQLASHRPPCTIVDLCIQRIVTHQGHVGIAKEGHQAALTDLADAHGVSVRQLQRLFRTQVGLSPKKLTRIIRLQFVLAKLKSRGFRNLTELTYAHGYADQSHFIRDFRELIGHSPRRYQNANTDITSLFTRNAELASPAKLWPPRRHERLCPEP
jgi:AraC-like DNA-binding protein